MEERELRSRVTWVVGLVLATAFVATIVWSVLQDSDGRGQDDLPSSVEEVDPDTAIRVHELSQAILTVHSDGCGVIRSELAEDPQGLQWSVIDPDGFAVLERNAVDETQYRYFLPGTYTVTLEAWGGESYVPISNTVEITC